MSEAQEIAEITRADMIAWMDADPEKVRELITAERVVRNGKVELVYQDGRYIGLDIQQRIRGKRSQGC